MRACFYDTWAFLALGNASDPGHALAKEADQALERDGFVIVTSDYILDETLTALHVHAGANVALRFLSLLEAETAAEELILIEVNGPRRDRALREFRRLAPKMPRLSFTDCTSFALMRELAIPIALTADKHFLGAGRGIRPLVTMLGGKLNLVLPKDIE